jgi:hypothetical protein
MPDTDKQGSLSELAEIIQTHIASLKRGIELRNVLGLPVLLAVSGFFISSGDARLFSVADRWQIFFYTIPVWVLVHSIYAFTLFPAVNTQTTAIVNNMRQLRFRLKSTDIARGGGMLGYGLLMGYLYSGDVTQRKLPPRQLHAAIEKYYHVCGQGHLLPYSRGLAYLEFSTMLIISAMMLCVVVVTLSGRVEGGCGYNGTALIVSQVFIVLMYILTVYGMIREFALLKAFETILREPRK